MKAPGIKDITKEDLYSYFEYINGDGLNSIWTQEQAELIGSVFREKDVVIKIIIKLLTEGPDWMTPPDALMSAIIFGFQCGREFEYRQMVKAMRDGAAK